MLPSQVINRSSPGTLRCPMCRPCNQSLYLQIPSTVLSARFAGHIHIELTGIYEILLRVTVQIQHLQCHQALVHYREVCLNELKRKRALSGIYSQNEVCTGQHFIIAINQNISQMKMAV